MKKTLVTAVFACAMTIFGLAAFAQEQPQQKQAVTFDADSNVLSSNVSKSLTMLIAAESNVNLKEKLATVADWDGKTLGYKKNGVFISLSQAVKEAKVVTEGDVNVASIQLGRFKEGDIIQFGYQDAENAFHAYASDKFAGDPNYYGGYNPESFYQVDFSEDPFNGLIEIVIGEPLPAPAVTLIVALAAGALFLLYKNRRQRSLQTEQA